MFISTAQNLKPNRAKTLDQNLGVAYPGIKKADC
jgi:hypothetical protein